MINTVINGVNFVLEGGHLFLQAAQVFPKSPAPPQGVINPPVVFQNPNADLVSDLVYRAVKTNLVFLDNALMIIKWSAKLSEMIPLRRLMGSLAVIRIAHIIHGLYWLRDDGLSDKKRIRIVNDLITNAVDVLIYGLYLKLGQTSDLRKLGSVALMCVDVYFRSRSFNADAMTSFFDNHPDLKADVIKVLLYSVNFAVNSGLAYSLYQAGKMLVKGSFAFDDYAISKACTLFYGVLTVSYGSFYLLREFVFDKKQEGIAKGTAYVIGAMLALIAMRIGFPNFAHTLESFKPQVLLTLIAVGSFGLTKAIMTIVGRLVRENDNKRQLLEWTSSFVISGLATAFLAPRLKIVEYTSRLWLSVLQISFLAAGVFLLVEAWYVGLRKLVLTVPPGDNLRTSFDGMVNDFMDWIPIT